MSDPAKTIDQNILPVQALFNLDNSFNTFIGQGQPFYATANPIQSGLTITNSTIDSSPIGATTPSTGTFTSVTLPNAPINPTDATNKQYVDYLAAGLSWKPPVNAATMTNITLSGLQTVDTIALVAGDTVLVKNQSTASENGIYTVSAGAWSRFVGADTWNEYVGAIVFVISGSQADSAWYSTAQPGGTLGVTAINWSNFSVSSTYTAGTGLTLSGTQFSITNTGVTAATKGSASKTVTATVNAQGQLTSLTDQDISIAGSQITSGTIGSSYLSGSYTGITTVGTLTGLTVSTPIVGDITGNAATATTAGTASSATTATNLSGGATGSVPYQTSIGATSFLAAGTNGQVLTLASGLPSWATPTTGTVTSVSGTGTVSGISLSGTVTSSGSLTLGGTLDLSSPPAIGGTTPNTSKFTTTLVGSNANFTDFPNAQAVFSQANTGSAHIYNMGLAGEGVATDVAGGGQWGVGVYGTGATAGATRGIGIVGDGHVSNTADTAAAIGVRGYATQTHAGGQNIGLYSQATGGATNYSLFMASGDIYSAIAQTWSLGGNLTFSGAYTVTIPTLNLTNALGVTYGGTGGITANAGLNNLLPSQTSNSGKVLTTDGTNTSWSTPTAYATVTDDTTTASTRYPLFASVTTGNLTTEYTSSTKYKYTPSSGILAATSFNASEGSLPGFQNTSSGSSNASYVRLVSSTGTTDIGRDSATGGLTGVANATFIWAGGAYPLDFWVNSGKRISVASNGIVTIPSTTFSTNLTLTDQATVTWDTSLGQVASLSLNANTNRTIAAPTNLQNGGFYSFQVNQGSTGGNTLTWNSVFKWIGGTAPTLSTGALAKDFFVFKSDGTSLFEQGRAQGVA